MSDGLLHLTLLDGQARALVALSTQMVGELRRIHGTSATATAALGRSATATGMLAAMMKNEGDSLSSTIKGGGPIGAIVCVGHADGTVKGYVDNPMADVPCKKRGKLDVGALVGSDGFLTIVRDQGFGEPYVGRVPLVTGEIAEDYAHYLLHSEQIASLVTLGVMVQGEDVLGAGGIILQPLPGCSQEALESLEALVPWLSHISSHCAKADGPQMLADMCLGDIQREVVGEAPFILQCDCGQERIEGVLLALGEEELRGMIAEQEGAQVTCHFCSNVYNFSIEQLEELIRQGRA